MWIFIAGIIAGMLALAYYAPKRTDNFLINHINETIPESVINITKLTTIETEETNSADLLNNLQDKEKSTAPVEKPAVIVRDSDEEDSSVDEETQEQEKSEEISTANDEDNCHEQCGINENWVIFYYSKDDSASIAMIPIAEEIESEGYTIYEIDNIWYQKLDDCFDLTSGEVPLFVCAGTKERISGQMSKSELEAFVIECNS